MSYRPIGRALRLWTCALSAVFVIVAAAPVTTAEAPPKKRPRVPTVVTTGPSVAAEPLRIEAVELREGAPGHHIDVRASGPVLWTSYRDPQDNLVVELTNSLPADDLDRTIAGEGPVRSVVVTTDAVGRKPLTRLIIETHGRVEYGSEAIGDRLDIHLTPVTTADGAVTAQEPLPLEPSEARGSAESRALEEARLPEAAAGDDLEPVLPPPARPRAEGRVASLDPQTVPAGTADDPVVAPPPAGAAASRLSGVQVLESADDTVIRIRGNGEFSYSYFSLENPDRFVVDLSGVVNESRSTAVAVSTAAVEQVRIAQFKPYPQPVSRIVFDLNRPGQPWIDSGADGLLVRFSPAPTRAAVTPREPAPQGPMVSEPLSPEPMESPEPMAVAEQGTAVEPDMPDTLPVSAQQERVGDLTAERRGGDVDIEDSSAQDIQEEPTLQDTRPGEQLDVTIDGDRSEARIERQPAEAAPQVPPSPVQPREVSRPAPQPSQRPVPADRGIQREMPTPSNLPAQDGVLTLGGGDTRYVGEPIDMSVRDADVVEVLRMFAQISGLNVVIQPGVTGTVTVELENVPWDQALDQILRINGLGFELEGNIMRVAPNAILEREAQERQRLEAARALAVPLRTILRRLSYADATEVAGLLRSRGGVLSQRGNVIVDQRTNTLIIKELPEYMDTVIAVIQNLDTPEPQVMIEARIVETTKRFSRTLGIQWSLTGEASAELGNTTGLQFPNNVDGQGGVNLLTGGDNGFIDLTLGNVLNSFNLGLMLQAAENEGLINILSAPKIATLNNQSANIQSGLQIPVQTVANNTVTVQFINATLELQVTPQVTAEGTVLMDINIAKREPQLAFAIQGASNAPISTKEATTRVIVRDGGTTVIGGIYEVSSDQGEDRVPGLANIPILGHLFRNKRRNDENEELLIFITPRVINL